jgi:DNA-binding transcriptional ArsR family regulator
MGYASPLAEAAVFLALADPTRRAILTRLRERELSVNAIAEPYAMSRPAVSKRFYRLAPEPLRAVDRWLEEYRRLWSTNLARLKTLVETEARRGQARNRH